MYETRPIFWLLPNSMFTILFSPLTDKQQLSVRLASCVGSNRVYSSPTTSSAPGSDVIRHGFRQADVSVGFVDKLTARVDGKRRFTSVVRACPGVSRQLPSLRRTWIQAEPGRGKGEN